MTESPAHQTLSRYRSQRKVQQPNTEDFRPMQPQELSSHQQTPSQDEGVLRSKSRYHRKHGPNATPANSRPATAADQDIVDGPRRSQPERYHSPLAAVSNPTSTHQAPRVDAISSGHALRQASPPIDPGALHGLQVNSNEEDMGGRYRREAHAELIAAESVPQKPINRPSSPFVAQPSARLFPPPRPEPVKPVANPPRADGPPTSDQIRAMKSTSALSRIKDEQSTAGCFGLFKRKRDEMQSFPVLEEDLMVRPANTKNEPQVVKPGGGGTFPGIDAPVSAVNAGDRSVLVECGRTRRIFPVTPTTTPVDLIKSAALVMTERIDVRSAVLLESFGTVGIQRPLRRYEHIRDVMNSWDTDKQNSLLLVDPGTGLSEAELSIAGVPRLKPSDASWPMFYSQKVGKWDKRVITLKEDGQITSMKDPYKPHQYETICHLSDYDIYTPTPEKLKKRIKPPKRHCFAVKSQQKTIMFESTSNFVHFFSTGDRATADNFYDSLHKWRSWYLVNVMGEGGKIALAGPTKALQMEDQASNNLDRRHKPGESFDSHYQLGSFKPLMDMSMSHSEERRPTTARVGGQPSPYTGGPSGTANATTTLPERRPSTNRRKQHALNTVLNKAQLGEDEPLANLGRRDSTDRRWRPTTADPTKVSSEDFMTSGLLGRSYSQRRREVGERANENEREVPWTTGPNLLNGGLEDIRVHGSTDIPRRKLSTRAKETHNPNSDSDLVRNRSTRDGRKRGSIDLDRSNSHVKDRPRPLVDLTPQYKEPPQHAIKGKGFHPTQFGSGGLIDNATTPADPVGGPPSADWRGRTAPPSSNRTHPDLHMKQRPTTARSLAAGPASPSPTTTAFAEGGLLASLSPDRADGERGRGVMDGSHAKGPMLNVHEQSQFVQGSLLDRVERGHSGPSTPVIDRDWDKRVVREERYGEAS